MKNNINKTFKGFKKVNLNHKKSISAGSGLLSQIIGGISSIFTGGISPIISAADDISNTVLRGKIIDKMNDIEKGEVELKKDGGIRLKWDSLSSKHNGFSSIIF